MHTSPTVIVVDTSKNRWHDRDDLGTPAAWLFSSLLTQVHRAADAGLPVALVAASPTLRAIQNHVGQAPITLAAQDHVTQDGLAGAFRIGVQACSSSQGWILLPSDTPMLNPSTLTALSELLEQHPVAYVTHRGSACMPMGFGQELFSELMRVSSNRELQRLVNRYPSRALEVREPDLLASASCMDEAPMPLRHSANALKR